MGDVAIATWLDAHPEVRLVVIDVFAKSRGPVPKGMSAYDADYAAVGRAKKIADHYGIAVVLVHHVRKAVIKDFLAAVSGTNGIAGAVHATGISRDTVKKTCARMAEDGQLTADAQSRYAAPEHTTPLPGVSTVPETATPSPTGRKPVAAPAPVRTRGLLTVDQAAEYLGMSPRYVRRLIAERRVPFHRLGRSVRLHPDDLDTHAEAGRVEPITRTTVWADLRSMA